MLSTDPSGRRKIPPLSSFLAIVAGLLMVISACSSSSNWLASSKPAGPTSPVRSDGLQKRIGVAPFEVLSQHTEPYSKDLMQSYVLEAIRTECPGIVFVKPSDKEYPAVLRELPRLDSGDLDNLQLAITGRQLGLNGVMVGTLTSVGTEEKERGIWLLKENRHYVRVQVQVEVYDTETGTKLIDEAAAQEVEIDDLAAMMIRQRDMVDSGYVEEVLEVIAQKIDDDICEAIGDLDWKSYVSSIDSDGLWIASGSQSGLEPGAILEVFETNTIMEGYGGHKYFKPGPKIAEVELVAVEPRRSKAVLLSGDGIEPLNMVKIKE